MGGKDLMGEYEDHDKCFWPKYFLFDSVGAGTFLLGRGYSQIQYLDIKSMSQMKYLDIKSTSQIQYL